MTTRAARPRPSSRTGRRNEPLTEWEALAILRKHLGAGAAPGVRVGIGDDAAVLDDPGAKLVWTTDACLEHVHFELDWLSPEDVAWKSLHAAVSDVAAMGASPVGALCHVTWTPTTSRGWLERFARGQVDAMAAARCPILGGNLALGSNFQVVTSVVGKLSGAGRQSSSKGSERRAAPRRGVPLEAGPLLRSGARVGDELWLFGSVGLASLGFEILRTGASARGQAAAACVEAFRRPRALVLDGPRLLGRATACLDVSDGLIGDAGHLARASGVRVVLDGRRLLAAASPELLAVAAKRAVDPLERLLRGGEDYALLATGPRSKRPARAKVIGRVESGAGVVLDEDGAIRELRGGGFEHGV